MAPLIVQVVATLLARIRYGWRDAARIGIAVMFLFAASSRLSPAITHDLASMIPPPLTGSVWLVYLTGVFEAAGAIGLLLPRYRRLAGICLVLLLVALFPANVYAALNDVTLRGSAAMPLLYRTPLQLLWIATVWWSAVARRDRSTTGTSLPAHQPTPQ
ncbi:MAG TPA: DoxX family membrane protein [Thermoanaerobaculia bacterium]|jgi:uncharacterized membrane protein